MTLSCLVGSLGATMARADSVTLRLANNNLDFGYLRGSMPLRRHAFIGQICEEARDMSKSKIAVIGGAVRSRLE